MSLLVKEKHNHDNTNKALETTNINHLAAASKSWNELASEHRSDRLLITSSSGPLSFLVLS